MKTPGTLYLIPSLLGESPISRVIPPLNIEVISILKYFIVEEIRTARRFLKKVCPEINFETISFLVNNEHSTGEDVADLLEPLLKGEDMGLLSEAGLPCIADPGAEIVSLAHHHHVRIIPLTGPSSLLLALMASGFNGQNFVFHGYLPIDKTSRMRKIRDIEKAMYSNDQTQIFIEAPYRNSQLFQTITEVCSGKTLLCIATDLTTESEMIKVQTIDTWKGKVPDINKRPTIFLLYR